MGAKVLGREGFSTSTLVTCESVLKASTYWLDDSRFALLSLLSQVTVSSTHLGTEKPDKVKRLSSIALKNGMLTSVEHALTDSAA